MRYQQTRNTYYGSHGKIFQPIDRLYLNVIRRSHESFCCILTRNVFILKLQVIEDKFNFDCKSAYINRIELRKSQALPPGEIVNTSLSEVKRHVKQRTCIHTKHTITAFLVGEQLSLHLSACMCFRVSANHKATRTQIGALFHFNHAGAHELNQHYL
jgi:hypothetical protein